MQYQIPFFIRVEIVVPISGIKYYFIGRIEVGEAVSFNKRPLPYIPHVQLFRFTALVMFDNRMHSRHVPDGD